MVNHFYWTSRASRDASVESDTIAEREPVATDGRLASTARGGVQHRWKPEVVTGTSSDSVLFADDWTVEWQRDGSAKYVAPRGVRQLNGRSQVGTRNPERSNQDGYGRGRRCDSQELRRSVRSTLHARYTDGDTEWSTAVSCQRRYDCRSQCWVTWTGTYGRT